MLKSYAHIDLPRDEVEKISKEIYSYLLSRTDNLNGSNRGWQFLNTMDLLTSCQSLLGFFKNKKLLVRDSAVTILYDDLDLPMHIDEPGAVAKINFPILNTTGWVNNWFDISENVISCLPKKLNQFGKEIVDFTNCPPAAILESLKDLTSPIVFNSSIPHNVRKLDHAESPRIVASFTFYNEPLQWLKLQ